MQSEGAPRGRSRRTPELKLLTVLVLCCVALLQITVRADDAGELIPFGLLETLDGSIGSEWEPAHVREATISYQRNSCRCSITQLPVTVYALHDEENLYFGFRMWPGSTQITWGTFRVFVILDNGDDMLGSTGDNLLVLPCGSGEEARIDDLDYHYGGISGGAIGGMTVDEQQDAAGIGRWHSSTGTYEFEIRVSMQSGDPFDMSVIPGEPFGLVIGFDAYDRQGNYLYSGQAPVLSLVVGL